MAFCGDGLDDITGANNSGCFSIGKATDNNSKEEFKKTNPHLLISNLRELADLLQETPS